MRPPHKLAAVLFADIAGYSAMMTKNEELALEKLSIFKNTLNKNTSAHSGTIVQYFGDGCLITFDSSVHAVECSVAIQEDLGKGTLVPVRIGIHTGDVVFKDGNVYGDAVNIASRIESIGQPGTVLVSNPIRKQIKSIKDFEFTSLGNFNFKNIDEAIEVYALSSMGFKVPLRSSIEGKLKSTNDIKRIYKDYNRQVWWLLGAVATLLIVYFMQAEKLSNSRNFSASFLALRQGGITLFDLDNETGDARYDALQCYINKYLTEIFIQNEIAVYNESTLCHSQVYLDILKSKFSFGPELADRVKSKYGLTGLISMVGDSIEINTKIIDIENNMFLFDSVSILVPKEKPVQGVNRLIDAIIASWQFTKIPERRSLQLEWEEEYLKAISNFEKDYERVLDHVKRCKEIDSTEYRADIIALEAYLVLGELNKRDSLLDVLDEKLADNELTETEANLYKVHLAIRNNNYRAAVNYYQREYEKNPKNLWNNFNMISHATQLINDSELAVKVGDEIQYDLFNSSTFDYHECKYCQDWLTFLTRALTEVGRYKDALNALDYAESMEVRDHSSGNMEMQIRALVRMGDDAKVEEKLEETKFRNYQRSYDYFLYIAAYEYHITGDSINTRKYYNLNQEAVKDSNSWAIRSRSGRMQIFLKEYDLATQTLKGVPEYYSNLGWIHFFDGYYGYALAKSGRTAEALALIERMEESKNTLDDQWETTQIPYYQAQVYAGLGDTAQTLKHLRESLNRGKRFYRWEFQHDPLFVEIYNDKGFKELLIDRH